MCVSEWDREALVWNKRLSKLGGYHSKWGALPWFTIRLVTKSGTFLCSCGLYRWVCAPAKTEKSTFSMKESEGKHTHNLIWFGERAMKWPKDPQTRPHSYGLGMPLNSHADHLEKSCFCLTDQFMWVLLKVTDRFSFKIRSSCNQETLTQRRELSPSLASG